MLFFHFSEPLYINECSNNTISTTTFLISVFKLLKWSEASYIYCTLTSKISIMNLALLFLLLSRYVKFVLTTSSRIVLLLILTFQMLDVTIFTVSSHDTSEELEAAYIEYRTHSTLHPGIVWIWIIGMYWLKKIRWWWTWRHRNFVVTM